MSVFIVWGAAHNIERRKNGEPPAGGKQAPQLAECGGHMVFHGLDADPEPLGDLPVRKTLVTAHPEDTPPLIGHLVHGDGDQQRQIVRLHLAVERIVVKIADGGQLGRFVFLMHQRTVVNVENSVFRHRKEVIGKTGHLRDLLFAFPDFQHDGLHDILRLRPVLQHPERQFLDFRSIMQIERIERLPIPLRQPIQYFPLLLHSKNVFTKIRNILAIFFFLYQLSNGYP